MKRTYCEQCYIALYWTLEHILKQSEEPVSPHPFSLCDLLSNMCPFTFATGMSADPSAYYAYEQILKEIVSSEDSSPLSGYQAGRNFLQMYMAEYEYELEDVISAFSLEDYTFAYKKAKEETASDC